LTSASKCSIQRLETSKIVEAILFLSTLQIISSTWLLIIPRLISAPTPWSSHEMSHVRLLPKVTYISSLPFPFFAFLLSSLQVNRRSGAIKRVGVLDINMSEFVSAGSKAALCLLQVLKWLFFCLTPPCSILLPILFPPLSLPCLLPRSIFILYLCLTPLASKRSHHPWIWIGHYQEYLVTFCIC
jgi:hypothetical protein